MATAFAVTTSPATGARVTLPSGEVMEWDGETWVRAIDRTPYNPDNMKRGLKKFHKILASDANRIINVRTIGTSISYGDGGGYGSVTDTFVQSLMQSYGRSDRRSTTFATQASSPIQGWLAQFYGGPYTVRLRGVTGAANPISITVPKGAKSWTVFYSKETDGGTITVDKSVDGGANWTATTSLNCNGTSALSQVQLYTVNKDEHTIFRLTAPATDAGYLEYHVTDAYDSGISYVNMSYGGSSLRMIAGSDTRAPTGGMYSPSKTPSGDDGLNTTFAPTNVVAKPDLVIYSGPMNDSGAVSEFTTNLPNAVNKAVTNGSSVLIVIEPISTTADDNGGYRANWDACRDVIFAAAATYPDNVAVFDWDRYLGPDGHNAATWLGDGVHPLVVTNSDPYISGGAALAQMFGVPLYTDNYRRVDEYMASEYTQATEPLACAPGSLWNDTSNASDVIPKVLLARPRGREYRDGRGVWRALNNRNTKTHNLTTVSKDYGTLPTTTNYLGDTAYTHGDTLGLSIPKTEFVEGDTYTMSFAAENDAQSVMTVTIHFGSFPNYYSLEQGSGRWVTIIDGSLATGAGGASHFTRPDQVLRHTQTFKMPTTAELAAATAAGVTIGNLLIRFETATFGTPIFWDMKIERGASMTAGVASSVPSLYTNVYKGPQSVTPVALAPVSNVLDTNAALSNNFHVDHNANITSMPNPTNLVTGTMYTWRFKQDATGGRTIAGYGSLFKFPAGTAPTFVTTANAVNVITGYYDGTIICANGAGGYA